MNDYNSTTEPPHLTFVTTVGDLVVPHDPTATVGDVLRDALKAKFGPDFSLEGYRPITVDGEVVAKDDTVRDAGLTDGDRLHIDPDPGLAPMEFEVVTAVGEYVVTADPDERVVDLLRRVLDTIDRDDMTGYQLVTADGDPLRRDERITDTDLTDGETVVLDVSATDI